MSTAASNASASASTSAGKSSSSTAGIKKSKPVFVKVDSLNPESKGENLLVKVVETKFVLERTKIDGSKLKIVEALVGDSTGTVLLTCRNEQCDHLAVGTWLYIRNSKIDMFESHMRLAVDRWGLIEPVPAKDVPKNEVVDSSVEKNLSIPEFELVNVPA